MSRTSTTSRSATASRRTARRRWRGLSRRRPLRNTRRADRVGEAIREEIATFLTDSAKDPRIVGLVTVTGVDVTPDLRQARAWISIMGTEEERAATLEGLASLAGHLRSEIGRSLRLRNAPEITFRLDETVARAARIESLLAQVRDEREAQADATEATDATDAAGESAAGDGAGESDVGTGEVRDDASSA